MLLYGTSREKLLSAVGLLVGAPVYEEALFTGLLFGGLARHFSFRTAAFVVSVTFAVFHACDLQASLSLVAGALLSCWAFARTGSIWPSILAHSALNAIFASVALY